MFVIEDEQHAECCGEFSSFDDALAELKLRARIPRDKPPNICPCISWKTCRRSYWIIEYNDSRRPWVKIKETPILEISSDGVVWNGRFKNNM